MINIDIIGTPSGFKCAQWSIKPSSEITAEAIEAELDIATDLILPSKGADLFLFRTVRLNTGKNLDYFILYRGADEINRIRPGAYYGAAIIALDEELIDVTLMMSVLRKLADIVKLSCIQKNRFIEKLAIANDKITSSPDIRMLPTAFKDAEIRSDEQADIQKFFLIDEASITLEQSAFELYQKIIKSSQQADIYFSNSDVFYSSLRIPRAKYPSNPKIAAGSEIIKPKENKFEQFKQDIKSRQDDFNQSLNNNLGIYLGHNPRPNDQNRPKREPEEQFVFLKNIAKNLDFGFMFSLLSLLLVISIFFHDQKEITEIRNDIAEIKNLLKSQPIISTTSVAVNVPPATGIADTEKLDKCNNLKNKVNLERQAFQTNLQTYEDGHYNEEQKNEYNKKFDEALKNKFKEMNCPE